MNIKQWIKGEITIKPYHVNFLIITGMFFVLFLYKTWPRFRSDANEIEWYWYLILMIAFGHSPLKRALKQFKK